MKKTIQFHKGFAPFAIFALIVVVLAIVGLVTKGVNLGVDFQAGLNQSVQLAYPAMDLSYTGSGNLRVSVSDDEFTAVFSGASIESRTASWNLNTVGTIDDLAQKIRSEGIDVQVLNGNNLSAKLLVPTYQGNFYLSEDRVMIHHRPASEADSFGSIAEVRSAVNSVGTVQVQSIGTGNSMQYMIRVRDNGTDSNFSTNTAKAVSDSLEKAFGADRVVIMKTDYIGARFSATLGSNTIWMTLATIGAILIYATIRFRFQYGLGAVVAIIFDACATLCFIVWTRMEFNTTSIAAILTILGYSINDTIVILDRIRDNKKLNDKLNMTELLDKSISEVLGRTVITSVTTLLAVFCLYFFTTGNIKDFALALIVGIVSGTFSTMFLACGFINFWEKKLRKPQKEIEA